MGIDNIIVESIKTTPVTLILVMIYFPIIWAISGRKLFKSFSRKIFWIAFISAWGIVHVVLFLILPIAAMTFDLQEPKNIGIKLNMAIIAIIVIVIYTIAPKDKVFSQIKNSDLKAK